MTIYKLDPLKPNCFYNPVREIIVLYKENLALFQANIIQRTEWETRTRHLSRGGLNLNGWNLNKRDPFFYHKVKSSILDIMLQIGDFPKLPL